MADQAPLTRTQNHQVPAVGTAGNDATTVLFQAPFACTVTLVNYVPASAITGANTNTRLVELVNKGQAGSGTTQVASIQFNSGVNAAADDEKAVTLSGTAANLVLAAGDTVIWNSTHVGTGITDPGGLVSVTLSRSDG
jgi:hypothetical protein